MPSRIQPGWHFFIGGDTMLNPISKRLLACAEYVRPGDVVADIGCDHGYLGIHLLKSGIAKRIIVFDHEGSYMTMFNPEILKTAEAYDTQESCLSLLGGPRKCKRYQTIKVQYQTLEMQKRTKNFSGWTAQIIQHEVDHCNGVLI